MHYHFDEVINRRKTNSYKWKIVKDELPMWVADMDFRTAPEITQAFQDRLDQDVFGYNIVPEAFNESIVKWWERRHQFTMDSEWVLFCTGVVPAISSIVRKLTEVNDNVVLLTPVYNIFFNSIINNDRTVLPSELKYDGKSYQVDFTDLEEKLSLPESTLMIFCNPHNPTGKVWDYETLKRIGELCVKYNVLILSDEIHCDLTHQENQYTPFAAITDEIAMNSVTCVSATKAFNLAGIQTAAIIVPNPTLRKLVNRGINTDEVAEPNTFAIQAMIAAFTEGEQWLKELNHYLAKNRNDLINFIQFELADITIVSSEATYLAWLDCSQLTNNTKELCQTIREQTGLILSEGDIFGGNGNQFIRLNYACPNSVLQEGLERLKKGIIFYRETKSKKK